MSCASLVHSFAIQDLLWDFSHNAFSFFPERTFCCLTISLPLDLPLLELLHLKRATKLKLTPLKCSLHLVEFQALEHKGEPLTHCIWKVTILQEQLEAKVQSLHHHPLSSTH